MAALQNSAPWCIEWTCWQLHWSVGSLLWSEKVIYRSEQLWWLPTSLNNQTFDTENAGLKSARFSFHSSQCRRNRFGPKSVSLRSHYKNNHKSFISLDARYDKKCLVLSNDKAILPCRRRNSHRSSSDLSPKYFWWAPAQVPSIVVGGHYTSRQSDTCRETFGKSFANHRWYFPFVSIYLECFQAMELDRVRECRAFSSDYTEQSPTNRWAQIWWRGGQV